MLTQYHVQPERGVEKPVSLKKLVIIASKEFSSDTRQVIESMIGGKVLPVVADDSFSLWKGWCYREPDLGLLTYLGEQELTHNWFSWRIV